MKLSKIEILIIIACIISLILGVKTLLETPTLIISPIVLLLIYLPISTILSLILGALTKYFFKPKFNFLILSSIFLTIICLTFYFKYHRDFTLIEVELDEQQSGYYFIVSTTDNSKGIKDYVGRPLPFDKNRVLYLDTTLFNNCAVRPVNKNGEEISKRMKKLSRNDLRFCFYNPSFEEQKKYKDEFCDFYNLMSEDSTEKALTKLGYVMEDSNIMKKYYIQQTIKN